MRKTTLALVSLCAMVLVFSAGIANSEKNGNKKAPKEVDAYDVHLAKKAKLDLQKGEFGAEKGRPSSKPAKEKPSSSDSAATGIIGEAVSGSKYAIVVGICDYFGTSSDLCWSDGDSLNMYRALKNYGYVDENIFMYRDGGDKPPIDAIDTLTDGAATRDNIYGAIDAIKTRAAAGEQIGEVVFFFSGHGGDGIAMDDDKEARDEGIVVNRADENGNINGFAYIWDGELKNWFEGIGTSRVVFIFDSCLSGGMNDVAETGRVVNMSSAESQLSYVFSNEPGTFGEGLFTHFFVNEGILGSYADTNIQDGSVTIEEAFDYAKQIVPSYVKRQVPVISDQFANDLLP